MLCNNCGQPTNLPPKTKVQSKWLDELEADHVVKCFCVVSKTALQELKQRLEEKLSKMIKEFLPGSKSIEEAMLKLDDMEWSSPLRMEFTQRFTYFNRVKARLQEFPVVSAAEERKIQKEKDDLEYEARRGGRVSLSDIVRNQR